MLPTWVKAFAALTGPRGLATRKSQDARGALNEQRAAPEQEREGRCPRPPGRPARPARRAAGGVSALHDPAEPGRETPPPPQRRELVPVAGTRTRRRAGGVLPAWTGGPTGLLLCARRSRFPQRWSHGRALFPWAFPHQPGVPAPRRCRAGPLCASGSPRPTPTGEGLPVLPRAREIEIEPGASHPATRVLCSVCDCTGSPNLYLTSCCQAGLPLTCT